MLDLSSFRKAIDSLQDSVSCYKNAPAIVPEDIIRDSVIQRFGYTYELAWKMIKRWLEYNIGNVYVDGISRRELFRFAHENKLIDDPPLWFSFHAARNQTSHIYDIAVAKDVFKIALEFAAVVDLIYLQLESRND